MLARAASGRSSSCSNAALGGAEGHHTAAPCVWRRPVPSVRCQVAKAQEAATASSSSGGSNNGHVAVLQPSSPAAASAIVPPPTSSLGDGGIGARMRTWSGPTGCHPSGLGGVCTYITGSCALLGMHSGTNGCTALKGYLCACAPVDQHMRVTQGPMQQPWHHE